MSIQSNGALGAFLLASFVAVPVAQAQRSATEKADKTEKHYKQTYSSETSTEGSSAAAAGDKAATEPFLGQGYAGLTAGWNKPTNAAGRFGFGAHLGLKATPHFSGGLYFLTSLPGDNTDTAVTTDQTRTHQYGVEGQYHFVGPLNGLSAGLRVGLATGQSRATETTAWTSSNKFALGPIVSYQYPVIESMLSVGVDASYLFVLGKGAHGDFLGGGGVTYWF